VTNLLDDGPLWYEKIYCAREDMGKCIKEQQMGLFVVLTSVLLMAQPIPNVIIDLGVSAYEWYSGLALKNTELAHSQMATIRLKLFKIGGIILRNTRRIRLLLSSAYPYQSLFHHVAKQLALE